MIYKFYNEEGYFLLDINEENKEIIEFHLDEYREYEDMINSDDWISVLQECGYNVKEIKSKVSIYF